MSPRRNTIIAAVAVLMMSQIAQGDHADLPEGVTPVMATWLWGHHVIPESITRDGSAYSYAYPHTESAQIIDPPWNEVAATHVKPEANAPAVLFLHGCSGLIRGGVGYRVLLMSEGYAVFEPDAFARPGHTCDSSSIAQRTEEVSYALGQIGRLPWVDQDRVILMGFSQGGTTVGLWEKPGFAAHVILMAPAVSRAPADVPVLAVAGADDQYAMRGNGESTDQTTPAQFNGIQGTWGTSYGMLTFLNDADGATRGTYAAVDGSEGRISGSLSGDTFRGYWFEAESQRVGTESQRQCDHPKDETLYWGRVTFDFDDKLDDEFSDFSGNWSYCDESPDEAMRWVGARMTNQNDMLTSVVIPGVGHDILGHPVLKERVMNFLRECCQ